MLRIRLARVGKKKRQTAYRIVVAEAKSPRDGAYLEWIGTYDPMQNPPAITLKRDRAQHWLSLGAQASDPVQRILDKQCWRFVSCHCGTRTPKSLPLKLRSP